MGFAFCPDGGLPRLIRYVTLEGNMVATLDQKHNLLRVDRSKLARLNEFDQQEVFKTQSANIVLEDPRVEKRVKEIMKLFPPIDE